MLWPALMTVEMGAVSSEDALLLLVADRSRAGGSSVAAGAETMPTLQPVEVVLPSEI